MLSVKPAKITPSESMELVHPVALLSTATKNRKKSPALKVTLNEGFLPAVKILAPVDTTIPAPASALKFSPKQRLVVGVSGVSCGGKTTVATALHDWLGSEYGDLLMQDDYYRPASELEINKITNFPEFDEPEAVKMEEIVAEIKKWKDSDSDNNKRRVLIVEGTMIFTNKEICDLCDLRYLVHVDFKTAEYRRSQRNYPIPDPPKVVEKNIWPKYIKHRNWFCDLALENGYISKQINGTNKVDHIVAGMIQDVAVSRHR